VNGVIGSSIFNMPAVQAELTGAWSPLASLIAALGVLTIVLCFAEVASRFQDAGGPYLYARHAFGPFVGFQAGWLTFWVRVTAVAAGLNGFVLYFAELLPWAGSGAGRVVVMAVVIGIITAVNVIGVRQATWTVNLFTLAKLVPLLALVAIGAARVDGDVLATQQVASPDWTRAILLLMFAYGGFEAPLIPAGEARDPRKDTAFALLAALAVVAFVYMSVQLVVVGVVPNASTARAPIAAAFGVLTGSAGAVVASLAAMISIYGYATGSVLQSPRVLYSMAERRELPASLAAVHTRFRTPHVSIVAYAALAFALALYGTFEGNATLSAIVRLVTYGLTCAALLVFRRQRPDEEPGFRLKAAPAVAAVAILFCLWLLSTRTFAQAWVLAAIMVLGTAFWWAAGRGRPPGDAPR
jgi:amino acid transporter